MLLIRSPKRKVCLLTYYCFTPLKTNKKQTKNTPWAELRINWLYYLYRSKASSKKGWCPGYDARAFDGMALVLEILGDLNPPSLPLLPGLLWSGDVVCLGPINGSNRSFCKLFVLDRNTWYNETPCQKKKPQKYEDLQNCKYKRTLSMK